MKDAIVIDGKIYPKSEKAWQDSVIHLSTINNWKHYHTWRSIKSVKGFPDLVLVRDNRIIFAELKGADKKKQKLSLEQALWIQALQKAVKEVYVWRPQDIDSIITILS
jgi:hypothetical protein